MITDSVMVACCGRSLSCHYDKNRNKHHCTFRIPCLSLERFAVPHLQDSAGLLPGEVDPVALET